MFGILLYLISSTSCVLPVNSTLCDTLCFLKDKQAKNSSDLTTTQFSRDWFHICLFSSQINRALLESGNSALYVHATPRCIEIQYTRSHWEHSRLSLRVRELRRFHLLVPKSVVLDPDHTVKSPMKVKHKTYLHHRSADLESLVGLCI